MDSSNNKFTDQIVQLIKDALSRFGEFFSQNFLGDKDNEELQSFLKENDNRFNPDGTLTDEYKEWIKTMEGKLTGEKMNEMLIQSAKSPEEQDAIRDIIGFVEERGELMKDYRKTIQIEYGGDTDAWVKDRATEGLDEQSRLERIKTIEENLGPGDDIVEEEDISASEGDIIE